MSRVATATLCAALAAIPAGRAVAAEYVVPPVMPIPTAWQGRAAAVVRVLDKLDAHVETLTLKAGETGSYKSLGVTVRSCMDRPDGLPADSTAFLDVQDRHGEVPSFSGWTFAREPAIGVFESPIYGVQLASCTGELVAPAAPPLPPPVPPPGAVASDDAAGAAPTAGVPASGDAGSSTSVDAGTQDEQGDAPDAGDGAPKPAVVTPSTPAPPALPGDVSQPDPVYPEGPPPPAPPSTPPQ